MQFYVNRYPVCWHYDFQVCSRWWSRSNDILMSLIVENVYGVWPLSWTLTRQALHSRCVRQWLCLCTIHAGTDSSDRLCSTSPWLSRWPASCQIKLNLKPGSYCQIPDITVNRRDSMTSWLCTHYILLKKSFCVGVRYPVSRRCGVCCVLWWVYTRYTPKRSFQRVGRLLKLLKL